VTTTTANAANATTNTTDAKAAEATATDGTRADAGGHRRDQAKVAVDAD
jgi:hypothetical protein